MPITSSELVREFGLAAERGSGALFIGAGMSQTAGLPGWFKLIEEPQRRAGVPTMSDAPLMAQYIADSVVGRAALDAHVLSEITSAAPTDYAHVHELMAKLDVREIWTTNYDQFIETACTEAVAVWNDEGVSEIGSGPRTVFKIHGSSRAGSPPSWDAPPVLTRGDYERYEDTHRRLWSLLSAAYLSRTFLFLGFSFSDPNIELLQRLSRRYGLANNNRHMAVMRGPRDPDDLTRYAFQRDDLERSGIRICEVDEYTDIDDLLAALVVRTRPPRVFISGSGTSTSFVAACEAMADELMDELGWEYASLGGPAGWHTSSRMGKEQLARGTYDAGRFMFYFRRKDAPPPAMDSRIGTAVYSDLARGPLVHAALEKCRAMLVIGGGDRTGEEIRWAQSHDVGIVPLACAGGAAHEYWDTHRSSPPQLGSHPVDPALWDRLNGPITGAARAASTLMKQAMYHPSSPC